MTSRQSTSVFTITGVLALLALAAPAYAQEGGVVTSGSATITTPNPTTTQIDQVTEKAIIQWNDFSIAAGSTTIFNQPSATSIALNRVTGDAPSSILGSLQANGQVWILNPNGILFGQGATINVGALMASTLSLSDNDFLSGNYHLLQDPSKAASYVVNQGSVTATSFAALIAPLVENSGSITSNGGQVYLLGTGEAILDINGSGLVGYSIGSVTGQTVHIRQDAVSDVIRAVVNTAGLVEAGSVVDDGSGVIRLVGAGGLAVNTGTISVSGSTGVSGGTVVMNSTNATLNVHGASIDASGSGLASAGGSILLLSKDDTYFRGTLTAAGGTTGDGGFIEVSGANQLWYLGTANAAPQDGANGTIVIDPLVLTIINGAGPGDLDGSLPDILEADTAGGDTVSEAALEAVTAGTDIILEATDNITMEDLTTDGVLSLSASSISFETFDDAVSGNIDFQDPTNSITISGGISFTAFGTGSLVLGNLTSTNNAISLTAGGDITFNSVNAGTSTIVINAGGEVLQGTGTVIANVLDITAATGITITGSDVNNFTADNGTGAIGLLSNAGPLSIDGITNGGGVGIVTANNLTVDADILADGFTVLLTSTLGTITAAGGADVVATNLFATADDGITLGSVDIENLEAQNTGSGSISITNTGTADLTLVDLGGGGTGAINTSGGVTITTAGALILEDSISTVGFTTALSAAGTITSTGGTVSATTLNLTSAGGVILSGLTVTNLAATNTAGGGIDLADLGGVSLNVVSNTGGGTVDISTTGSIGITQNVSNAGGNAIDLTATGGGFSQTGGTVATTGAVTLTATNGAYSQTGGSISSGALTINATTGIALVSVTAAGTATLTTSGGDIALNGSVNAGTNALTLSALGGAVTWSAGTVTANALTIDADDGIEIGDAATRASITTLDADNNSTGAIDIFEVGGFTVTAATTATGNITLNSTGALVLNGAVDTGTAGNVTLAGSTITQSSGTILGDILTLASTGNVSLGQTPGVLTVDFLTGTVGGSLLLDNSTALEINTLVITTTGDIESNGALTQNGNITSGGALSLDANANAFTRTAGLITAPALTLVANSVTGTLTTALGNLAVDLATGNLTIANTGNLVVAGAGLDVPGGTITITSSGSVGQSAGSVNATSLAVTAVGGITLSSVSVANLAAANSGSLNISITDTAGDLTVTTVSGVVGVASTTGNVSVSTTGILTLTNNVSAPAATGVVTLTSTTASIGGAATVNAASLILNGATGIDLDNLNVTNLAAFNSTSGDIVLTTAGAVDLENVGTTNPTVAVSNGTRLVNISTNAGAMTVTESVQGGAVTLTATGASITTLAGGTISSGALTLNGTTVTIGGAITATGAVNVTTTAAGGISVAAGVNSGANNQTYNATAGGGVFTHTAGTINGGTVAISAAGSVTLGGTITSTSLTATSSAGDILLTAAGTNVSSTGTMTLDSTAGVINHNNGTLSAGGLLTASADDGITLGGGASTLTIVTLAADNSTGGAITVADDTLGLTVNSATNAGPITLSTVGGALTLAGAVNAGATNDVTLSATGAGGSIGGAGALTAQDLVLTAAAGINLTNTSIDTVTGTNTAGTFLVTDTAGVLEVVGAGVTSGGNVTLTTPGDLTLTSTVTSGATASLTSLNGTLVQGAATPVNAVTFSFNTENALTLTGLAITNVNGTVEGTGNIDLTTAGTVTVTAPGLTVTTGDIILTSAANIVVAGNVDADVNTVTFDAAGSISQTGGTVTGQTLLLTADAGIALTSTASVAGVTNLVATNATTGDISITGMTGPVEVDGAGVTNNAAGGNARVATDGDLSLVSDVTVQAGGTVALAGATITQAGGTIVGATRIVLSADTDITLTAMDATELAASSNGGTITLDFTGSVAIVNDALLDGISNLGGSVVIDVPAGDFIMDGGTVDVSGGTITVTVPAGAILWNAGDFSAGTAVLSTLNGIALDGGSIANLDAVIDVAGTGDISIVNLTGGLAIVQLDNPVGNVILETSGQMTIGVDINAAVLADLTAGDFVAGGGVVNATDLVANATAGGSVDTTASNVEASNASGTLTVTTTTVAPLVISGAGLTGTGSITLVSPDDINTGTGINLGGTATLIAAGAIVDGGGAIVANGLVLDAGTTIDPLTTTITNLQVDRTAGDFTLTNTGNLVVFGTGIDDAVGNVTLDTTGTATFNAPVVVADGLGSFNLDVTAGGSIAVNASLTADLTPTATINLTSTGGNVAGNGAITADTLNVDAAGSIGLTNLTFNNFSFVAGTGITIVSNNPGGLTIDGAGLSVAAGSISVTTTGPLIIDADVTAPVNVTLASTDNIVDQISGLISAGALLTSSAQGGISLPNVEAASFNGSNTVNAGDIVVSDTTGGLTITGATNTLGLIDIVTTGGTLNVTGTINAGTGFAILAAGGGGNNITGTGAIIAGTLLLFADTGITLTNVQASTLFATNDFTVPGTSTGAVTITDSGGISVSVISNPGGPITLTSSGTIALNGLVDAGAANDVTLTSTTGAITSAGATSVIANDLIITASSGAVVSSATIDTLTVTTATGAVSVTDTAGGLTVNRVSTAANGSVGAITLITTGDLTLNGIINSGANAMTLTANGGAIIHATSTLTAGTVTANAANGITLGGGVTTLNLTGITATNSTANLVTITDVGGITNATINNGTRDVTVTTTGVLSGGNITAGLLTLTTTGGATLTGHNLTSLTVTNNTSGNVSLTGGTGSFSIVGTGVVTPGATTIMGTGSITIAAPIGTLNQNLTLSATAGSITRTGATTLNIGTGTLSAQTATGGTLGSVATGAITFTGFNGTVTGVGTLNVLAAGTVTVNVGTVNGITVTNAAGSVVLTSSAGSITLGANLTGAGNVTFITTAAGTTFTRVATSNVTGVALVISTPATAAGITSLTTATGVFSPGSLSVSITTAGAPITVATTTSTTPITILGLTTVNGAISLTTPQPLTINGNINSGTAQTTISQTNTGGTNQIGGQLTAANLSLTSVGGMTITNYISNLGAGGTINLRASNTISGNISITGGQSNVSLNTISTTWTNTVGNITVSTTGNITLNTTINNTNFTTSLTSQNGTITRLSGVINATTVLLNAELGITLGAGSFSTTVLTNLSAVNENTGNITLQHTGTGTLNIVNSGLVNLGGDITLTTSGGITFVAGVSNFPFTTTLTAGGAITGSALIDAFRLNLSSVGGQNLTTLLVDQIQSTNTGSGGTTLTNNITTTIVGTGISNTVGPLTITIFDNGLGADLLIAANINNTGQTTIFDIFGGQILQTAGSIQAGTLRAFSDFGITLTNLGSMTLQAINFTAGPIDITSSGNLTMFTGGDSIHNFDGNISVVALGNITAAGLIFTDNGFVHMQAGGDFTATGSITATTDVQLRATGAFNMGTTGLIDGPVLVDLDGGNVTLNDITTLGPLIVDATGTLSIGSAGLISTIGAVDLQASGAVTVDGDVFAGGTFTLATPGSLSVSNGAILDSPVSVVLASGQIMTLSGAVTTGGAFTANSLAALNQTLTGTITAQSAALNSLGGVLTLGGSTTVAGNVVGYGLTGLTQAGTGSINAVNVTLTSPGSVTLHNITGSGFVDVLAGANGSITQSTPSVVSGTAGVSFQAGQSVLVSRVTGASIQIMAINGDILDNNDTVTPNALNLVSTGTITLVANGHIGRISNPIEVQGGFVTVFTNGFNGPVEIALNGTTTDGIVTIGSAPAGTIIFFNDNLLSGGGNVDRVMNWYRDLLQRGYDVWSQIVLSDGDTEQHRVILRTRPAPKRAKTPLR